MAVTQFDKATCKTVSAAIKVALDAVAKEHGLTVEMMGGRYEGLSFTPKVVFKVAMTADGKSGEEAEFSRWALCFNMTPKHYGTVFTYNGTQYRLVGFKTSSTSKPFVCARVKDGVKFNFPRAFEHTILGTVPVLDDVEYAAHVRQELDEAGADSPAEAARRELLRSLQDVWE